MTRLEQIAKRAEAATKGPWYPVCITGATWVVSEGPTYDHRDVLGGLDDELPQFTEKEVEANAKFQAAARADIPYLLALVRKLCDAGELLAECPGSLSGCGWCPACKLKAVIAEAKG